MNRNILLFFFLYSKSSVKPFSEVGQSQRLVDVPAALTLASVPDSQMTCKRSLAMFVRQRCLHSESISFRGRNEIRGMLGVREKTSPPHTRVNTQLYCEERRSKVKYVPQIRSHLKTHGKNVGQLVQTRAKIELTTCTN